MREPELLMPESSYCSLAAQRVSDAAIDPQAGLYHVCN
jgi:hypothetical protein